MIWRAILVWLCLSTSVFAQGFPALYDVTGVAADDTLNLRAAPTARADRLGALASNATGIEVIGTDATGRWGQINTGEQAAWASLRFLERQLGDWRDLITPLQCFGTEPFWSANVTPRAPTTFEVAGEPPFQITPEFEATPYTSPVSAVMRHRFLGGDATTIVRAEACNDGMTDREYGLSVVVAITQDDGMTVWTGCCSLTSF